MRTPFLMGLMWKGILIASFYAVVEGTLLGSYPDPLSSSSLKGAKSCGSYGKKFDCEFETHEEIIQQAEAFRKKRKLEATPDIGSLTSSAENDEVFDTFVAHKDTMTCSANEHASQFDVQVRGVCLGGWMVLEPWITPSLFYQFLGKNKTEVALDTYTFCEVLGPVEGNKQLRRHWDAWLTEDIVRELALSDHVDTFRLPVGDWSFAPYGPFVGCTDGSVEYIDQLLDWADEYGIKVLFDIHAMKGSQNGFDNSGQARRIEWTSSFNSMPQGDQATFMHWPIREANFMGAYDFKTSSYPVIDYDNINHGLSAIKGIVEKYKDHPAVFGLQPLNEPWEFTPEKELKQFYFDGYLIVKKSAPHWKYVMHDMFRFEIDLWGGFMAGCPGRVLDTHIYQAWKRPSSKYFFYDNACKWKRAIAEMEDAFGPVIVGEWSLATDNCAMFLNGFNDNIPGYPMRPCKYVRCPDPYMGTDQPGTPIDPGKSQFTPYGTGTSSPIWGKCPIGRDWVKETYGGLNVPWMYDTPEAPLGYDETDEVMGNLALKKLSVFSGAGHGYFFWNFRTELPETPWSYILASRKGWIPTGPLDQDDVKHACDVEDKHEYVCKVIRDPNNENVVRKKLISILKNESMDSAYVDNLSGEPLYDEADSLYTSYWLNNYVHGKTCDYGGTARIGVEDVTLGMAYFLTSKSGVFSFVSFLSCFVAFAAIFVVAMRHNKAFNIRIRKYIIPKRYTNSRVFVGNGAILGSDRMHELVFESDLER